MASVEPFLLEFITPDMLTCWAYTHNRWCGMASAFPKKGPFNRAKFDKAARAKIPAACFTSEEIDLILNIRPWLVSSMNGKVRPSDEDMGAIRGGQLSKVPKSVLRKWENMSDLTLFKTEPLTKAVPNVPPAVISRHPCLAMFYRHFVWLDPNADFKSQSSSATAYALTCVLEWRYQVATTGRLLALEPGKALREAFEDFLSTICEPTLDNFVGPSNARRNQTHTRWANWDRNCLNDVVKLAQDKYASPDMRLSDDERTLAAARIDRYRAELADLRKRVGGMLCAQNAPHVAGTLEFHVAQAFDDFVTVSEPAVCTFQSRLR